MSNIPWPFAPPLPPPPPAPTPTTPTTPPALPPEIHTLATASVHRYHDTLLALLADKLGHRISPPLPWPDTTSWTADTFLEVAENYRGVCVHMCPLQPDVDWKWRHDHEATGLRDLVLRGRWGSREAAVLENWLRVCGYMPLGDRVGEEVWWW